MRRLIVAILLIVALLVFCIWAYGLLDEMTGAIGDSVTQTQERIRADDFTGARSAMEDSYALWSSRRHALGALIRHTEIDDIENLYQRARQALDNEDGDEALLQIRELRSMLAHLPEMEAPSFQNIF